MAPKDLKVGDNNCLCIPFTCCFSCLCLEDAKTSCTNSCFGNLSIGFNSATLHRIGIFIAMGFLFYSDFYRFNPDDFGSAAVRSGGILTASSSWLPLYPMQNALLHQVY